MTDATGFAFIAGLAVGYLLGLICVAAISSSIDKKRIKTGVFYHDGSVYKVTEIRA